MPGMIFMIRMLLKKNTQFRSVVLPLAFGM